MLRRLIYSLLIFIYFQNPINGQTSFDLNEFDWSIHPTDDFFTFVNGPWMNTTIMPPSQTDWGSIYTMIYETSFKLKHILDDLTRNGTSESPHPVDSIQRKLSDLYLAGLDEEEIEKVGIQPLKETFIQLESIQTYQELILFILDWYKKTNQGLLFRFEVYPDSRNSSVNIATWMQTGTQLPERGFYFRNDPMTKNIRLNYINYIHRLLTLSNSLLNLTTTVIDAQDILTLETQLAVSHRSATELRDSEKNYNKYTVIELDRLMSNLGWQRLLNILEIKNTTMIIGQPEYYQLLNKLIVSQPLNIWKNKIRFTILHKMSKYLNKDFVEARFQMFDHIIQGQLENRPRWMRIIEDINLYIGELLGQLYVQQYFSYQARQRTLDLVNHLIKVYYERIRRNQWMSEKTKEKALGKLGKLNIKIGYPSQWKSYQDVHMNRRSYYQSMLSVLEYTYRKKIRDLSKSSDRNEWFVPPQMVNALYVIRSFQFLY